MTYLDDVKKVLDDSSSRERESSSSSSSSSSLKNILVEKSNLSNTYSLYDLEPLLRQKYPRAFEKNFHREIEFEYHLKDNLHIVKSIDLHVAFKCNDLTNKTTSYYEVRKFVVELYKFGFLDLITVPTNMRPAEIYFIPGHPLSSERIGRIQKQLEGFSEIKYDPNNLDKFKLRQKKIWKVQSEAAQELKDEKRKYYEETIQDIEYCKVHPDLLSDCWICAVVKKRDDL